MKKLFLLTAAFASMLFASCEKEEMAPAANETTVTYTVEIPDVQVKGADTKAIGDGFNVDELVYEVWKTENGKVSDLLNTNSVRLYQKTAPMVRQGDQQRTTISLNLVQDQEYTILFWAQNAKADAYVTDELTKVTYSKNISSGDYISNREDMAAFYGVDFVSDGDPKAKTVYLKRPFAQLNLGTKNTATDYVVKMNTTEVVVNNVPMAFNVATKTSYTDQLGTFVFKHGAVPGATNQNGANDEKDATLIVNDQTYEWAAMNYMFATNGGQTATVKYAIATTLYAKGIDGKLNGETTEAIVTNIVENVPLKENFRTNIVGNLLTSTTDYNVIIDATWDNKGDGNIVEVWDGKNVQEPYFNAEKNQYEISLATELAWLAAAVNGTLDITTATGNLDTPQKFNGKTFVLMEDIDLANYPWTPIGATGKFEGTFDGNGKTIKNLNISIEGKTPAGLFANAKYVRNLYVNGAVINAHYKAGVIVGDGLCSRIENCHVSNAEVTVTPLNEDDGNHVGGIVGYLSGENEGYVKGCSVKESTIKGYRDVAGIAGTANQTAEVTGNIVANVTVIADQTSEYVDYNKAVNVAAVAGRINAKANVSSNTVGENVVIYTLVGNSDQLQNALNCAVAGDNDIRFAKDITGNVVAKQAEGKNIVVDGKDKKYDGTITINGDARSKGAETLTFKNINFKSNSGKTFIEAPTKVDGKYNYSHNVTVYNCTFTSDEYNEEIVGIKLLTTYNAVVKNCVARNIHSLAQFQSTDNNTVIEKVEVVNCKNGISLGNMASASITNAKISAKAYGIRLDGEKSREVGVTISGSEINAFIPVNVRKMNNDACNASVKFEGDNKLEGNVYDIALCSNEYEEGVDPVAPMGTFNLDGAENFKVYFGDKVDSASTLDAALNTKYENTINVEGEITSVGTGFEVKRDVVLDFNNLELNAGSDANSRWYALEIYDSNTTIIDANFIRAGVFAANNANVVFMNGIINHKPERSSRYIFCAQSGSTITIKDGTFKNDRDRNSYFWADAATIVVEGGHFAGVASKNKVVLSNGGQVIIKGGTFNFDPSVWVAEGYQAVKSGSTWTVSAK